MFFPILQYSCCWARAKQKLDDTNSASMFIWPLIDILSIQASYTLPSWLFLKPEMIPSCILRRPMADPKAQTPRISASNVAYARKRHITDTPIKLQTGRNTKKLVNRHISLKADLQASARLKKLGQLIHPKSAQPSNVLRCPLQPTLTTCHGNPSTSRSHMLYSTQTENHFPYQPS